MARVPAALLLISAVWIASASAEVFRCPSADGPVRYVDRADACERAEPLTPTGRVIRIDSGSRGTEPSPGMAAPGAPEPPDVALDRVLPPVAPVGWELVREAPVDPRQDPDLVRWGVRAQRTQHYTRYRGDTVQVCSVEVWAFDGEERARTAQVNVSFPGWRIEREASLLLMTRAVSRRAGQVARRGLFPDCSRLADRARALAAAPH
jgi:hypothetical protein